MSLVFLDIGAHEGQTLLEVLKPSYGFDCIHAFEPMPRQFKTLQEKFGEKPNLVLYNYGLANRTDVLPLYGTNDQMEASLYAGKNDVDESIVTQCRFVRASEFFASNLKKSDDIYVKVNCEGCEIPILQDLLVSGEIWKVNEVMIDFDIRKVEDHEHEERNVLNDFKLIGFDRFSLSEQVMQGKTHQKRIANWLEPRL